MMTVDVFYYSIAHFSIECEKSESQLFFGGGGLFLKQLTFAFNLWI